MRKLWFLTTFLAFLALPALAQAPANYAMQCADTITDARGVGRSVGTVVSIAVWDGVTPYAPLGLVLVPYTGQSVFVPPAAPSSVIPGLVFWARLTPAEQAAFETYVGAHPTSLGTFVQILTTQIDLGSALTAQWMAFMVSIGAITAARVAIVLTPTNNGQ
jgi:hypothetical protein